jgi:hypothetical protein
MNPDGEQNAPELHALRELLKDREVRLNNLRAACRERQQTIDDLQQACDERLALIHRLNAEIDLLRAGNSITAPADGVDWKELALQREAALERLSAEAERRSVLLAELTAALHERNEEVGKLQRTRMGAS